MSDTAWKWVGTAATTAACLFIWWMGYTKGLEEATFSQACENAGGRMDSAMTCVVPTPTPEERTLGA